MPLGWPQNKLKSHDQSNLWARLKGSVRFPVSSDLIQFQIITGMNIGKISTVGLQYHSTKQEEHLWFFESHDSISVSGLKAPSVLQIGIWCTAMPTLQGSNVWLIKLTGIMNVNSDSWRPQKWTWKNDAKHENYPILNMTNEFLLKSTAWIFSSNASKGALRRWSISALSSPPLACIVAYV